eukprot:TRINITY_DN65129_c0_g1_i1.p1 TRINITY_DN65129_c0_g1~~TRINITY_DN65129_c0_g1_i1.p1  ORF type:complete len:305 (+),score=52.83 TRINITY_DN65129_c0_g1_i1:131-1045(+)
MVTLAVKGSEKCWAALACSWLPCGVATVSRRENPRVHVKDAPQASVGGTLDARATISPADALVLSPPPPHPIQVRPARRGKAGLGGVVAASGRETPSIVLSLSAAFAGGCEDCAGCQLLLSGTGDEGGATDTTVIAEQVQRDVEHMSPWERIGSVFAYNQAGRDAYQERRWGDAERAYIRALAYAGALSFHGALASTLAAWAPSEQQQSEVRRWCGEVFVGLAKVQLQLAEAEASKASSDRVIGFEGDADDSGFSPSEETRSTRTNLLQKCVEAAERALELDERNGEAYLRLGMAKQQLAKMIV